MWIDVYKKNKDKNKDKITENSWAIAKKKPGNMW